MAGITINPARRHRHKSAIIGPRRRAFLPAGPFAILPLTGKRSSLVWTENCKQAMRIIALSDGISR
jgi:2-polyprenyl-6-methoxyphenol hydroxylase-like FAD-dependent oxidoreductase